MNKQVANTTFQETKKAIAIIKKNVAKLSESEKATIELLLDKEARKNLAASLKDAKNNNLISWDEAKKELL